MGCGFAEIGSVTPLPQPAILARACFRLIEDGALINRSASTTAGMPRH
jgi:dihydroorotate dehydrogenase